MPPSLIGSVSSFYNPIRSTELSSYETDFQPIDQLMPDNKWDRTLKALYDGCVSAVFPFVADVKKENLYACSSNKGLSHRMAQCVR